MLRGLLPPRTHLEMETTAKVWFTEGGGIVTGCSRKFTSWVYARLHIFFCIVSYINLIIIMFTVGVLPNWIGLCAVQSEAPLMPKQHSKCTGLLTSF
eukprot:3527456-Amphidinium_carterae.1